MKCSHFEKESISVEAYVNIRAKFRSVYTEYDLHPFYCHRLPVFVRWHNRNVYGTVCKIGDSFFVSNFFRIKRDGSPVRLYVGLD